MTEKDRPLQPISGKPSNWRGLAIMAGILLFGFSVLLYQLARFSIGHELYSHLVLIPAVSGYLVWSRRHQLAQSGPRPASGWAVLFFFAGAGMLAGYLLKALSAEPVAKPDALALGIYSLVLLLTGACFWFLNRPTLRVIAFPLGFLVLMAPFPASVETGLETFLQHGSAIAAFGMFTLIGTPVFRDGTLFHLPGFHMQVAPECSGIHSTLALFITGLVAGQVLLRSNWYRAALALAVIPIALLRNGLRVTTVGELCVRIGPEMIDSYIHRNGGPIFFVISLVPFSCVLLLLLKLDRKKSPERNPFPQSP